MIVKYKFFKGINHVAMAYLNLEYEVNSVIKGSRHYEYFQINYLNKALTHINMKSKENEIHRLLSEVKRHPLVSADPLHQNIYEAKMHLIELRNDNLDYRELFKRKFALYNNQKKLLNYRVEDQRKYDLAAFDIHTHIFNEVMENNQFLQNYANSNGMIDVLITLAVEKSKLFDLYSETLKNHSKTKREFIECTLMHCSSISALLLFLINHEEYKKALFYIDKGIKLLNFTGIDSEDESKIESFRIGFLMSKRNVADKMGIKVDVTLEDIRSMINHEKTLYQTCIEYVMAVIQDDGEISEDTAKLLDIYLQRARSDIRSTCTQNLLIARFLFDYRELQYALKFAELAYQGYREENGQQDYLLSRTDLFQLYLLDFQIAPAQEIIDEIKAIKDQIDVFDNPDNNILFMQIILESKKSESKEFKYMFDPLLWDCDLILNFKFFNLDQQLSKPFFQAKKENHKVIIDLMSQFE